MNIELPVAINVRVNTDSLYQQCLKLIEKIYPLDGFDAYLFPDGDYNKISDPVKIIWEMCRLGKPLCELYNLLKPSEPIEIKQNDSMSKSNASKRYVFHFIQACRTNLHIPEDELFNITDVFKNDTNLFVKVINVINILLKTIEDQDLFPQNEVPLPFNIPTSDDIESPKDNRARLVAELLNSERSYVQDLERLHNYQIEAESKILSKEDSITLFSNLDKLLDFQRNFLIHMEAALAVPTQEQDIGELFLSMEEKFDECYQVFCANQDKSAKFALENCDLLMKMANVMEPKYELPSYLIKPVQRICKYPLLLNELLKYDTKAGHPYCDKLQAGLDSIKRVTELTNELKRQVENEKITEDLKNNIQDWKGVKVNELGLLKLSGNFTISNGTNEREYALFLFENMLLCCQEKKKKGKAKITYILKGSIYMSSVVRVSNKSVISENIFALKIYWNDKNISQSFVLKSINEEQCNRWISEIEKLIKIEETKNETLKRNRYQTHTHDFINQYNSRVNQVDSMFIVDDDYDNSHMSIQSPYPMYNKIPSRTVYNTSPLILPTGNLGRSKSQPNIYNPIIDPRLSRDKGRQDHYNKSSSTYSKEYYHNNTTEYSDYPDLPAPQRTVSNHVKHNHSMGSLKHYPKYNEPDEYNNPKSVVTPILTSQKPAHVIAATPAFQPHTAPLPPTPESNDKSDILNLSKSFSNLGDLINDINNIQRSFTVTSNTSDIFPERKESVNASNTNDIFPERKESVYASSNTNDIFPERKESVNASSNTNDIFPERKESVHASIKSSKVNEDHRRPSTKISESFSEDSTSPSSNSLSSTGNDQRNESIYHPRNKYNSGHHAHKKSDPYIESEYYDYDYYEFDSFMHNYEIERSRVRERSRSKSRNREKSIRERGYERDYDSSRAEIDDYERFSRREKRDEENYIRNRSRSQSNKNLSYMDSNSIIYDSYDSPINRNPLLNNFNGTNNNSYNNYINSPRSRPSTPNTPISRPTTPNRPSNSNINRPTTPSYSPRPSTPVRKDSNVRRTSDSSRRISDRSDSTRRTSDSSKRTSDRSDSTRRTSDSTRNNYTRIRVSYDNQDFIITAPSSGCTYEELISKIERKIRLTSRNTNDNRPLRIRFKDEDNDFVTISTEGDITYAFEATSRIWKINKESSNEPIPSMIVNLYADRVDRF